MYQDYNELIKNLDNKINLIQDSFLKKLCENLVGINGKYRAEFVSSPAAKRMHHAYFGGLLEHSLEVADFCISDFNMLKNNYSYEELNLDLLISASLLHDLGKIDEYEIIDQYEDTNIYGFTEIEKMIGHLCLSAMMVYSEIDKIDDFPQDIRIKLSHIILAHHGRTEWGTAKIPFTKEAEFFHMADHRSATIAKKV